MKSDGLSSSAMAYLVSLAMEQSKQEARTQDYGIVNYNARRDSMISTSFAILSMSAHCGAAQIVYINGPGK